MDNKKEKSILEEYDITSSPMDLTFSHIVELIETGQIEMPLFQREYVWDIKRASKLIDSLIMNLPIPEIFLFIDSKDGRYKVIDGQQRLMSLYFYFKQRFPKDTSKDKTARLRMHELINRESVMLKDVINDSEYFKLFRLEFDDELASRIVKKNMNVDEDEEDEPYYSQFEKKTFQELDIDVQNKLRLRRSIRAQVLRQNKPDDGGSAMYEIFNRLNTGGIKLSAQEIRASLYYCPFYTMMQRLNNNSEWRRLQDKSKDLRSKDIEHILTGFAFLENEEEFLGRKQRFLNSYSLKSMKFSETKIRKLEELFKSFLVEFSPFEKEIFYANKSFSVLIYETLFAVLCKDAFQNGTPVTVDIQKVRQLLRDVSFRACLEKSTSTTETIHRKFTIARSILLD